MRKRFLNTYENQSLTFHEAYYLYDFNLLSYFTILTAFSGASFFSFILKNKYFVGWLVKVVEYYRPCPFVLAAAIDFVTRAVYSAVKSATIHLIGPLALPKSPMNSALSVSRSICNTISEDWLIIIFCSLLYFHKVRVQ